MKFKFLISLISIIIICSNNNIKAMNSQINDSNSISVKRQCQLINFSEQLFMNKNILLQYHNDLQSVKQKIKQYINTIDDFIESKDDNILTKLINIVIKSNGSSIIVDNIKLLHNARIIDNTEYKKLLNFILFLNIGTDLRVTYATGYYHTDPRVSLYSHSALVDHYCNMTQMNTKNIIQELTNLVMPKYFIGTQPESWINERDLCIEIIDACIDKLHDFKTIQTVFKDAEMVVSRRTILSTITKELETNIDKFFESTGIKQKMESEVAKFEKTKKLFYNAKLDAIKNSTKQDNTNKLANITSKYILENINDYAGNNIVVKMAKYKNVPSSVSEEYKKAYPIIKIVNSYSKGN